MTNDKAKGYRTNEEVFILYEDDNQKLVSAYVYLIELTDSFVVFKTNSNLITIPSKNVKKIKQRCSL
jgi:hypothetical protein